MQQGTLSTGIQELGSGKAAATKYSFSQMTVAGVSRQNPAKATINRLDFITVPSRPTTKAMQRINECISRVD
jgi:hypothetical protein